MGLEAVARSPEIDEATAVERAAVGLLSAREHSRQELNRKLRARHHDPAVIDRVLDDLERRRLLSDVRFAEQYVAQRSRKGYGPLRIRAELADRGVSADLVADSLEQGAVDWAAQLADLAERKFGDEPAADQRELGKRGRFLEQRGFPISLVRRYLERVRSA